MLSGFAISSGVVFSNIAAEVGIAGIASCFMNSQSISLVTFNAIVFGQEINAMQGIGVASCVIGAVMISLANVAKCG